MTFQGGGFKSHSSFTGVMAGLLAAQTDLQEMLQSVEVLSSISGGSWFISQLIYSPNFEALVTGIARSPETAYHQYWHQWLVPFLDSLVMSSSGPSSPYYGGFLLNSTTRMYNDRFVFHSQPSNKTATILMDFIEVLFEVIYAAKPNTSWETFVSALLNNMGDLPNTETLDATPNTWALHKTWSPQTTVSSAAPKSKGGTGPGTCSDDPDLSLCILADLGPVSSGIYRNGSIGVSYSCSSPDSLAAWSPAHFTVKLGGADMTESIFCEGCRNMMVDYTDLKHGNTTSSPVGDLHPFTGSTPVVKAVAASSAFLGDTLVLPFGQQGIAEQVAKAVEGFLSKWTGLPESFAHFLANDLQNILDTNWAVYTENSDNDAARFNNANAVLEFLKTSGGLISAEKLEEVAEDSFIALVDGGLSDATGVANAVYQGADEIVAFGFDLQNFKRLTESASKQIIQVDFTDLCPFCYANFKVFAESPEELQAQWAQVKKSFVLHINTTALNELNIGTLHLTTAENTYYGIPAGRDITIHLISVISGLGIGGFAYEDYATLVQDLVRVMGMPENGDMIQQILLWLRRPSI